MLQKFRWRVTSLGLFVLGVFVVWLEPTRVLWGALCGQAFYQGRPTSYWRAAIAEYRECNYQYGGNIFYGLPPDTIGNRIRTRLGMQQVYLDQPAILQLDSAAVPVLTELLYDRDPAMREEAVTVLGATDTIRASNAAGAALLRALRSPHRDVRWRVAHSLEWSFRPEDSQELIPVFIEWLQDEDWVQRSSGAQALERVGPLAKAAVPALVEALRKENREDPEFRIKAALRAIDPEEFAWKGEEVWRRFRDGKETSPVVTP